MEDEFDFGEIEGDSLISSLKGSKIKFNYSGSLLSSQTLGMCMYDIQAQRDNECYIESSEFDQHSNISASSINLGHVVVIRLNSMKGSSNRIALGKVIGINIIQDKINQNTTYLLQMLSPRHPCTPKYQSLSKIEQFLSSFFVIQSDLFYTAQRFEVIVPFVLLKSGQDRQIGITVN